MNKYNKFIVLITIAVLASMVITPLASAMPVVKRPMDMLVADIEGSPPQSVDYSFAYDTASGGILQNTMDTLIQYSGETTLSFIGDVAYAWTGTDGGLNGNYPIRLNGTYGETLADGRLVQRMHQRLVDSHHDVFGRS